MGSSLSTPHRLPSGRPLARGPVAVDERVPDAAVRIPGEVTALGVDAQVRQDLLPEALLGRIVVVKVQLHLAKPVTHQRLEAIEEPRTVLFARKEERVLRGAPVRVPGTPTPSAGTLPARHPRVAHRRLPSAGSIAVRSGRRARRSGGAGHAPEAGGSVATRCWRTRAARYGGSCFESR